MFPFLEELLLALNTNKLFWGVTMVLMNMGSRFVIMDVSKNHEQLLMSDLVKKLILFCMFFVGTRDIITALMLTFAFSIIVQGLLDHSSRFCILPTNVLDKIKQQQTSTTSTMTAIHQTHGGLPSMAEYEKAKQTILVYEEGSGGVHRENANITHKTQSESSEISTKRPLNVRDIRPTRDIYKSAISLVKKLAI